MGTPVPPPRIQAPRPLTGIVLPLPAAPARCARLSQGLWLRPLFWRLLGGIGAYLHSSVPCSCWPSRRIGGHAARSGAARLVPRLGAPARGVREATVSPYRHVSHHDSLYLMLICFCVCGSPRPGYRGTDFVTICRPPYQEGGPAPPA